jgi:hypothetical protein
MCPQLLVRIQNLATLTFSPAFGVLITFHMGACSSSSSSPSPELLSSNPANVALLS